MSLPTPETHLEYAQRIGAPRVVPCDIALQGALFRFVWVCRSHEYQFNERPVMLRTIGDRCPMSRLEEWRARVWEAAA